jgi:hypothetical protein
MTIYTDNRIPYFYIIKHIPSGKLYAGSRHARNCSPTELLTEDGYLTSSTVIRAIIEREGLNSFTIEDIILESDIMIPFGWNSIRDYETYFLKYHDCASSDVWINSHNNENVSLTFRSPQWNSIMMLKYGSVNFNNRTKYEQTCLEKYNVTSTNKLSSQKNKSKQTSLEKYGVDHHMKFNGAESLKSVMLIKYGVDNIMKIPEVKLKAIETRRIKYLMKPDITCPHCGLISKASSKTNMVRYHFDNCKVVNPNRNFKVKPSSKTQCPHCLKVVSLRGKGRHFDNCKSKPIIL